MIMKRLSTPCNQEMNAIAIIFGNDTTATISWAAGSAVVVLLSHFEARWELDLLHLALTLDNQIESTGRRS